MSVPVNARALQEADAGTSLEVLPPVLFNTYKHHAGSQETYSQELTPSPVVQGTE